MGSAASGHDEFGCAREVLRRLTDAYLAGQLPQAAYRSQRRRLLEALAAGESLPDDMLTGPRRSTRRARRIAFFVAGLVLVLGLLYRLLGENG